MLVRLSAMAHPPQVVNMSYGAAGPCQPDLQAAVKVAVDKGSILVASAGNDGSTTNESQFPANCASVVAVGAFDFDGKPWADSQRQPYVSLGGPGVEIPGYDRSLTIGTSNGTSDAAAIVSGEFALLRSHFPTMPSRQLVARLFATTLTKTYKGPGYGKSGNVLGFGPALVHAALTMNVPTSAPNPVYDALDKIGGLPSGTATETQSSGPTHPGSGSGSTVSESFPGSTGSSHKAKKSSSAVLITSIAALALAVLITVVLVLRSRRRRPAHLPPYPPAPGGYSPPAP